MLYSTYLDKLQQIAKYKPMDVEGCKAIFTDMGDELCKFAQFEKVCSVLFAVIHKDYKWLRLEYKGSVQEMSEKLLIPQTTLYNWENGNRKPPQYLLQLIGFVVVQQLIGEGN